MIVQIFCVCVCVCVVCDVLHCLCIWNIPCLHTVEYQRYILMEYQECWTGVIVEEKHYLILSGPDMPAYWLMFFFPSG